MATEKVLKEYDEGKKMEEALASDSYQDTFESIMLNLAPAGLMVQGTKQLRKWFLKGLDNPKLMGSLMKVLGPADRKQVNKWLKSESKDIQKIHSKNIESAERLKNLKKPEYTMEDGVMFKNPQPKFPSATDPGIQKWYKHTWDKNPINPKNKKDLYDVMMRNSRIDKMNRDAIRRGGEARVAKRYETFAKPKNMEVLRGQFRDMPTGSKGVNPLRDLLGPIGLGTAAGAATRLLMDEEQDPSGGEWFPPQTLPSPYEPGMSRWDDMIEDTKQPQRIPVTPLSPGPVKFNPEKIVMDMNRDEIF